MPLRRLPSRALIALAVLACSAIAPATAHATLVDSTVQQAVEAAPQPVRTAAPDITAATRPAAEPKPVAPAPHADGSAVQQTVAPIAGNTGPAVPSSAVVVPASHLREPAQRRVSHISASTSSARRTTGEGPKRPGTSNRTALPSRPSTGEGADARVVRQADAARSTPPSAPPASEPLFGPSGADAAGAAGGSSGFSSSSGGGLALLVAALLLAGPRLRRRLLLLPVVCRPAAFHVVLERPG
jgi:hypothetical protein